MTVDDVEALLPWRFAGMVAMLKKNAAYGMMVERLHSISRSLIVSLA